VIVAFLLVAAASAYTAVVRPATDAVSPGSPADAVVALAGPVRSVEAAQRLVEQGVARELVLSNAYGPDDAELNRLCTSPPPGYRITCFVPDPDSTRGEARAIRKLARERGWNDVIVVTPTFHISRARLILRRCYSGRLRMVDAKAHISPSLWAYSLLYQPAAFVKAAVLRGC
jgi:uncharacterized SAM-binding protein YcdF (DUF218 family)